MISSHLNSTHTHTLYLLYQTKYSTIQLHRTQPNSREHKPNLKSTIHPTPWPPTTKKITQSPSTNPPQPLPTPNTRHLILLLPLQISPSKSPPQNPPQTSQGLKDSHYWSSRNHFAFILRLPKQNNPTQTKDCDQWKDPPIIIYNLHFCYRWVRRWGQSPFFKVSAVNQISARMIVPNNYRLIFVWTLCPWVCLILTTPKTPT